MQVCAASAHDHLKSRIAGNMGLNGDAGIREPPEWSQAKRCYLCDVRLRRMTGKKHHCRHCGQVICEACTGGNLPLLMFNIDKPSRVCTTCFSTLQAEPVQSPTAACDQHTSTLVPDASTGTEIQASVGATATATTGPTHTHSTEVPASAPAPTLSTSSSAFADLGSPKPTESDRGSGLTSSRPCQTVSAQQTQLPEERCPVEDA